jgi:hypothetical protein
MSNDRQCSEWLGLGCYNKISENLKDRGGDWRRGGVNESLIKFFHKNLAYLPCSTPQAKNPEIKLLKTLTNMIEMILTKLRS